MLLEKFRGTSYNHKIFTSIEIATPAMNVRKICKLEKQYEIDMWSMMQAEKYFCKPTMNSILNFPYILQCPSFAVKYMLYIVVEKFSHLPHHVYIANGWESLIMSNYNYRFYTNII